MTSLERLTALVARRLKGGGIPYKIISTRERDLADVEALLLVRGDRLDRAYLDPRVHELAALLERPNLETWYLEKLR